MTTTNDTLIDLFETHVSGSEGDTLVDAFTYWIFEITNFVILCGLVGLFGSVSNVIYLIVFFRMGIFSSVSNLNLFSLAIADFGVSITSLLHTPCFILTTAKIGNLNWDPFDVFFITVFLPHSIFTMTNRLITPYVALERCICVVFPFKVKAIFTLRRSFIASVVIFAYSIISMVPRFAFYSLQYVLQDGTNKSKLVLISSPESYLLYEIYMNTNFFALSFASVIFLLVITVITSSGIRTSKNWRKSVSVKPDRTRSTCPLGPSSDTSQGMGDADAPKTGHMSDERIDKETRLVKMIMLISIMYLVLYVPELMSISVMYIDPRISTFGQYWRLSTLLFSFSVPISATNSSINIFFYYGMSTAYRKEFRRLFGLSNV